ncbi:putative N-acetyltransferase YjcF [compost metagenome]
MKMRQVAVDESLRGQQVGRRMVVFAEEIAREEGYARFVLNARQVAIPFYEKLGYNIISEEFTEVGIPHRKMAKLLQSE